MAIARRGAQTAGVFVEVSTVTETAVASDLRLARDKGSALTCERRPYDLDKTRDLRSRVRRVLIACSV